MGQGVNPSREHLDPLHWPLRFQSRYGRPPRVLHVGNVANYAYANAALMRRYGVDVEVIDPDSYHIMASPEWYEARVHGNWGDDFNPQWASVDVGPYVRPEWFSQGHRDLVFARLTARVAGDRDDETRLRARMERANRLRSRLLGLGLVRNLLRNEALAGLARGVASRVLYRTGSRSRPAAGPEFPPDVPQTARDLVAVGEGMKQTFSHFDVVQGYALGALYPLVARHPATVAYELGTLRGLPFEETEVGRTCAWVYRQASRVFVTNVDCIEAAQRLGIPEDRTVPMLHAFDTDAAADYVPSESDLKDVPADQPYFFAPGRHHWTGGSASFLKGNNLIVEAAAEIAAEGLRFRIVFVSWGEDVGATRDLIAQHGLTDRAIWISPRSRRRLWPVYHRATAVIDQFAASALGGVGLEALALGKRLLSSYDEKAGARFFGSSPPMKNCRTGGALASAMRECLSDPDDRAGLGRRAREWMIREHGVERQMRAQFGVYEAMTEKGN